MKNIITKIAQKWADMILKNLQKSKTDFEFDFWMNQGFTVDNWCVNKGIYLN